MEYEAGEEDDRGHLVEVDYEDNDEYDFMDDSERPRLKKVNLRRASRGRWRTLRTMT
jgi:hypothetical protein